MEPRKGAIAFCSLKRLGLITSEIPIEVTYNDGNKGISWVGIQLTDGEVEGIGGDKGKIIKQKVGDPWMSRNPKVVAYLDDIANKEISEKEELLKQIDSLHPETLETYIKMACTIKNARRSRVIFAYDAINYFIKSIRGQ